ncbi:TetR family transcriptional regulator [Amycolatopsis mediterranei S699]|uniref:TetR family transcriptional regulator n=2 Tax=Amycolatopsis mediterranei TaxID=33910 RepID=A0A0H3DG17_AMYMU|nr:TetR family transcriptional regulator [Amycolatopsis mediterranei]ADJ49068.1 TetR family transcriptional regulator [Amycolatopsis mediterranei U32]AEK46028.1 TetR family transcriptional regulator [Amycolatopsis mediterranei S699]AFO80776.1 TetR family transcriptional regulator [Amycolatopsis mediterranei S699]AGT87904.1 TetR family transcriptional regulator [Amycolatopsis mediterranei RB]KDO04048.1 TetR family transcriptional regulator [Amycolatopsis mediterranei]
MQPKVRSDDLTFTEAARRKQIVAAAIDTIAEVGYTKASFAKIAQRAGLSSPSLISYHFADKDELIGQVVAEVCAAGGEVVRPHADPAASSSDTLRAYVEGSIAFYDTHRRHLRALMQILNGHPHARERWVNAANSAELDSIEQLLARGQRDGEFRSGFAPHAVAMILRDLLAGALLRLLGTPDLDVSAYTRELVALCLHSVEPVS